MSEEIEEIFTKYTKVFMGRQDEIKAFLLKYFKQAFKESIVENVERVDATERIKKAGFSKNISARRNTYRNIILTSCEVIKGEQKRFDYKFLFVEERLDEETVEKIEEGLKECDQLVRKFQFDDAIGKVDEMIEMIRLQEDAVYNKRLFDRRREIMAAKEKYEKGMEQIKELEEKVILRQKEGNYETVVASCKKIIQIAESIKSGDIKRKYTKILEDAQKKSDAFKEISKLENRLKSNQSKQNYEGALKNCEQILKIGTDINNKEIIEKYTSIKEDLEKQVQLFREKNAKALEKIERLEEEVKMNEEKGDYEAMIDNCNELIELSKIVRKFDLTWKYRRLLDEAKRKLKFSKDLKRLEEQFENNKKDGEISDAINNCLRIVRVAGLLKRDDLAKKYKSLKDQLKEELASNKERIAQLQYELNALEQEFKLNREKSKLKQAMNNCERILDIADLLSKDELVVKYSKIYQKLGEEIEEKEAEKMRQLERREELLEKAKELEDVMEIEENVLPIVEEFSVHDILGDLSSDIGESLDKVATLLENHRVEVKKEVKSNTLLTSASGEIAEIEKVMEVQEPKDEMKAEYSILSGFENPFDDLIEEAIITDLIPYNFEIQNVELNGKPANELPEKMLTEDGLEVKWELSDIKPKEKVDINYNLRRRVSRSVIFTLEDRLKIKIIKTHANIDPLEFEGLFEARLSFSNPYQATIKDLVIEDIIPLYYLNFIEEPTTIIPATVFRPDLGELIKWKIGDMDVGTQNYQYKLLELYRFEELKILIKRLSKEGIDALENMNIEGSFSKFMEIRDHLDEYISL